MTTRRQRKTTIHFNSHVSSSEEEPEHMIGGVSDVEMAGSRTLMVTNAITGASVTANAANVTKKG